MINLEVRKFIILDIQVELQFSFLLQFSSEM